MSTRLLPLLLLPVLSACTCPGALPLLVVVVRAFCGSERAARGTAGALGTPSPFAPLLLASALLRLLLSRALLELEAGVDALPPLPASDAPL